MRIPVRSETDALYVTCGLAALIAAGEELRDRELAEARVRLSAALEDELREFGADEVIISTLPRGRSNGLEAGILQRLRDELDVPITHVVDQEIERS